MEQDADFGQPTRMLFLGDDRLADGFRLIGFETWSNPAPAEVDRVLRDLVRERAKAFVLIDDALMAREIPHLRRVMREGGRIVVMAVPALNAPPRLASTVARRVDTLFGNSGGGASQPPAERPTSGEPS